MIFKEARMCCHVRNAIYRESNPTVKYSKNHEIPLGVRVPIADQQADDWLEYDCLEN